MDLRILDHHAAHVVVMMIAMTTPSAASMILLYARATRYAQGHIRHVDGFDKRRLVSGVSDLRRSLPAISLEAQMSNHCRAPAEFLMRHNRPGRMGALRMGIEHGAFCVGCCWVLMTLLFVGGIMNALWISALAIIVLLEKLIPQGPWFARVTGVVLVAWGAAALAI